MIYVDATCPLVSKVHLEAARHHEDGLQMVMIGHEGHPETIGTMGQLPEGEVLLVETAADVAGLHGARSRTARLHHPDHAVGRRHRRRSSRRCRPAFPAIVGPHKEDICYATTNRQAAVKAIAPQIDALLVIGAPNSSNSHASGRGRPRRRLRLCPTGAARDRHRLARAGRASAAVGITAGASAPEVLVNEVHRRLPRPLRRRPSNWSKPRKERVEFKVPRILREPA